MTGRARGPRDPAPRCWSAGGYSLLELLFAVGVLTILSAVAVPSVLATVEGTRARGAARYLAARFQQAKLEALKRSAHVGFRFEADEGFRFRAHRDGNGDGLRTADLESGTDPALGAVERLDAQFAGVTFGVLDGVTAVDGTEPLTGDPIRLGSSDILSFGPLGTATAGTLYLHGRSHDQYAVRVLGATGRVRVLRYDFTTRRWVGP